MTADNITKSDEQAKRDANQVFYKIEAMLFDAVREEFKDNTALADMIHSAITASQTNEDVASAVHHAETQEAKSLEANSQEANSQEANTQKDSAQEESFAAIRDIITAYVIEAIEDQAPPLITKTLLHALSRTTHR